MLFLFVILPGVWSIGTTPSPYNNYDPLPFKAVQFVKPVPTKKGPILFPNDAPPPPPTPLIVTSRPLAESIARSELNPNNSITAQSQLNQISFKPHVPYNPGHVPNILGHVPYNPLHVPNKPTIYLKPKYLARIKNYSPYSYITATNAPVNGYQSTPSPYKNNLDEDSDEFYTEYENFPCAFNLRRTIFDNEQKIEKLNIRHSSLYSREKDEFDQRRNNFRDSNEDNLVSYRWRNRDRNIKQRIRNRRAFRTNDFDWRRKIFNRKHKWDQVPAIDSEEDVIQERSLRPLYALRSRNEDKHIPVKQDQFDYEPKSPSHKSQYNSKEIYEDEENNQKGDNYAFSYTVKDRKTGDDFSHSQQSTGSATNGEYRVRLPDGRMQIVSYTADENGYKADVRYDDQHHENSIDANGNHHYSKGEANQFKAKEHYYEDIDSEFPTNKDYVDQQFKAKSPQYYFDSHEKGSRPHKNSFDDYSLNDLDKTALSDENDDYLDNKNSPSLDKLESSPNNDRQYYKNDDLSQEIDDYSSEDARYQPHKSKFASLTQSLAPKHSVTPSYESLKHLFVTNTLKRLENKAFNVLSTLKPSYETTTENVVLITSKRPHFYTNVKSFSHATPVPVVISTPRPSFVTTPSSYLVSTIANLRHQINLQNQPVLSKQYLERLNKYLSFKK